MDNLLTGKRILLFSQYFFGYEKKIQLKYQELGACVDLFDEMSINSSYERAFLKVAPGLFDRKTEKYYMNILESIKNNYYDYVLFIDCEMPTVNIIRKYKKTFPNSKFCLHMWDSVENLRGIERKFDLFDLVTTFDLNDSLKYNLLLRPLFYCDDFADTVTDNEIEDYKFDLSFIGTIHSDRFKILKSIIKAAKINNNSVYFYPYLQNKAIYYFYKIFKPEFRDTSIKDFRFDKLPTQTISEIVKKTRVVIDIQHPKQSGLTMRTIEMLGMRKKLVTTNDSIRHYDFYNDNDFCVIDRNTPLVRQDFLYSPYTELDSSIYKSYSIVQWCKDVIGIK